LVIDENHDLSLDVLLLCPDTQVAAISEHVRNSWLSHADIRTRSGGSAAHQRAAKHLAPVSVEVHGFGERDENYEIEQSGDKGLLKANEIGLSNKKNRAGEEDSENGVGDDVQLIGLEGVNTVGTGRLLRRWRDWLKVSRNFRCLAYDTYDLSGFVFSLIS
jgi:hypothetical protein